MNCFSFAYKRIFRSFYPLLAVLCAILVYLASLSGAAGAQPQAGVCDLDGSRESERMLSYLLENNFVLVDDVQTLMEKVEKGELDCGAVLPQGLSAAVAAGELEGIIRFVETASSFSPELYRSHLAAALFREYAPYITAAAFDGTVVSREQVLEAYEACFEEGYAFAFEVESAQRAKLPEDLRSQSLVTGAVAVLLFLLIASGTSELLGNEFGAMLRRIGLRQSLCRGALPNLLVKTLVAVIFMLPALWLTGGYGIRLIPSMLIYALLLLAADLLLAAVLPEARMLTVLLPVVLIASLALCPIYTDLALFSEVLGVVRCLLPPYWLWLISQQPLLWLCAGVAALPFGCLALFVRYRLIGKYR